MTYTKSDIGFIPFTEPTHNEQKYYEGIIKWAYDVHGFTPDQEHDNYPKFMLDFPMIEFPDSDNENLYADFIDTTNFMNTQLCDNDVAFDFVDGELQLVSRWE